MKDRKLDKWLDRKQARRQERITTVSWMKCNYDPLGEDEQPDLSFPFSPNAPPEEQIANLIFRFSEYLKAHKHINACLQSISTDHYRVCDTKTLLELKQPIQVLLYSRESLRQIEEALQKDIDFCNNILIRRQELLNGQPKSKKRSKKDTPTD